LFSKNVFVHAWCFYILKKPSQTEIGKIASKISRNYSTQLNFGFDFFEILAQTRFIFGFETKKEQLLIIEELSIILKIQNITLFLVFLK
jgi:hypothetical protein